MQRVQRGKQQAGDVGHAARVLYRYPVTAAHVFHLAALLTGESGKFRAHVARRQVRNHAIADSGARVVDGGQMEMLQEGEQREFARHARRRGAARRGPIPVTLRRPARLKPASFQ